MVTITYYGSTKYHNQPDSSMIDYTGKETDLKTPLDKIFLSCFLHACTS